MMTSNEATRSGAQALDFPKCMEDFDARYRHEILPLRVKFVAGQQFHRTMTQHGEDAATKMTGFFFSGGQVQARKSPAEVCSYPKMSLKRT